MRPMTITPDRLAILLAALREGVMTKSACQRAGINFETFRSNRRRKPEIAKAIADAIAIGIVAKDDEMRNAMRQPAPPDAVNVPAIVDRRAVA